MEQLPAEIERRIITSGIESRDEFERTVTEMLSDPVTARILANQYGIFSSGDAKDYWNENFGSGPGKLSSAWEATKRFFSGE